MNGLISVLDRFPVKAVLMTMPSYPGIAYDQFLKRLKDYGIPVYSADDGTDFRFGDLTLNVLYPFEPISGVTMKNVNNASPVIRVESPNNQILLMGDAEQEVESALLAKGVDLEADILKAGHHGSKTSSTLPFLEAVDPELMLISVGLDNDYGHPSPTTLEKAAALGIEVRRTDLEGRISLCVQSSRPVRGVFDRIVRIRGPCKSRR
jgi:competence protein ComEC